MIEGKRIAIRAWEMSDLDSLCELMNDPRVLTGLSFQHPPNPMSKAEQKNWLENITLPKPGQTNMHFAVVDKKSKKFIGGCSYNRIVWKNKNANQTNLRIKVIMAHLQSTMLPVFRLFRDEVKIAVITSITIITWGQTLTIGLRQTYVPPPYGRDSAAQPERSAGA